MGKKKVPRRPNKIQEMLIRKAGYNPYDCMVLWDNPDSMLIIRRGAGREIIEK